MGPWGVGGVSPCSCGVAERKHGENVGSFGYRLLKGTKDCRFSAYCCNAPRDEIEGGPELPGRLLFPHALEFVSSRPTTSQMHTLLLPTGQQQAEL